MVAFAKGRSVADERGSSLAASAQADPYTAETYRGLHVESVPANRRHHALGRRHEINRARGFTGVINFPGIRNGLDMPFERLFLGPPRSPYLRRRTVQAVTNAAHETMLPYHGRDVRIEAASRELLAEHDRYSAAPNSPKHQSSASWDRSLGRP